MHEVDNLEKEFTEKNMIEFARWFNVGVGEDELQNYRDVLKAKAEEEFQLYLALKAKYG
jgi:hypothetical protein